MAEDLNSNVDIYDVQTETGDWIRVYEWDGAWQSAVFLEEDRQNELVFTYMRRFNHIFAMKPDIERILLIGGAGYAWPNYVLHSRPHIVIDAADTDPNAYQRARDWFFLEESDHLHPYTEDGRSFLDHCDTMYDAVINDAFCGSEPVPHLHTVEALRTVQKHLRESGIYAANLPGGKTLQDSPFVLDALRTAKEVFPYVIVTEAFSTLSEEVYNYVLFAASVPLHTDDMISTDGMDGTILRDAG
ncbi:MAG: fused MFS/spermidine synthase [Solobacterium sp.]|jgi:spermidine synthase|nr:fused MFS/spermidine synthase [Solobacterium sp.]